MKTTKDTIQIEYTRADGDQAESLVGFDPTSEKDRKFLHDSLDEYLDYLARRYAANETETISVGNRFIVFDLIDAH